MKNDDLYLSKCSQVESEITALIDVLVRENVRRFLEVGSRFGGSLWRIANALPKGSLIVSCDSGSGMGGKQPGATKSLRACIDRLSKDGYDAHLVIGDSQLDETISQVKPFAPFDAVFIDADHELRGVTKDWNNYGSMARIVAFHDVGWRRPDGYTNSKAVEVSILWDDLKTQYRSEDFIDRSAGGNMGIGVLWTR